MERGLIIEWNEIENNDVMMVDGLRCFFEV